jgi:CubicO group peptidase (beta-lactamase class C family)
MTPINPERLNALVNDAKTSRSTALVVWQEGSVGLEWWFHGKPRPIETMSATKSVVNLIVGRAVTLGLLEGADTPVYTFYPEWQQGKKREITVRHLLSHTSGLQNLPNAGQEIYPSPDFVQLALAAELEDAPGTRFSYNNKATNLLTGIVARASGKSFVRFARDEFFHPLEINFDWMRDEAGNAHGMAGLKLFPRDLLKLGRLALQNGVWNFETLIRADWLEHSLKPGSALQPSCGWLWWLVNRYSGVTINDTHLEGLRAIGATDAELEAYSSLKGEYATRSAYLNAVRERVDDAFYRFFGKAVLSDAPITGLEAFYGEGYLGQYVVVVPEHRVVAVSMREWSEQAGREQGFEDFVTRVCELCQS